MRMGSPINASERFRIEEFVEHSVALKKLRDLFPDVVEVQDAIYEKVLLITEQDVHEATPGNPANCAIAVNQRREGVRGLIGRQFGFLIHGQVATRYQLQKDAQVRTAVFDSRGTMESGAIHFSPISPSNRLVEIARRAKSSATKTRQHQDLDVTRHAGEGEVPPISPRRAHREMIKHQVATRGFRTWNQATLQTTLPTEQDATRRV
jgi:hypothetical protein